MNDLRKALRVEAPYQTKWWYQVKEVICGDREIEDAKQTNKPKGKCILYWAFS